MKQIKVLIKIGSLGYVEKEVMVTVSYEMETVATSDEFVNLFGPTMELVNISQFDLNSPATAKDDRAQHITIRHLKGLVREYIETGDTLKAGMGMLHLQLVYTLDTEAYNEMRRVEAFWNKSAPNC